jgi:hypothetical protein
MTGTHNDALQGLRDIHLPAPVSFWPPAPGWWLLALVIVLLLVTTLWLWKRYRRTAYRRAALKELQKLQQALQQGQADTPIIAELSILLRRVAISRYGRQQVAALNGRAWLEFLDRTGRTTHFSTQGHALLEAPYRRHIAKQAEPLLTLAQRWLQVQS